MERTPDQEEERKAFFAAIVKAVFRAAHEYRSCGPARSQAVVDASAIVDALAFTQALMLEFHPSIRTEKEMRDVSERVGQELFRLMKAMRRSTEESGSHPIADFGVANPMVGGAN